jgi:MFS family permease
MRLLPFATRIEENPSYDAAVPVLEAAAAPLAEGRARDVLSGQWLGHALHPLLTDYPLGCWTSAMLLDVFGGREHRSSSRRLIGIGLLAVAPTAASGLSDWSQVGERGPRRVGVAHAAVNATAATLYLLSWLARRKDAHGRGVTYGVIGGLFAIVGGFLGGHLSLTAAVTRDNRLIPDEGRRPAA